MRLGGCSTTLHDSDTHLARRAFAAVRRGHRRGCRVDGGVQRRRHWSRQRRRARLAQQKAVAPMVSRAKDSRRHESAPSVAALATPAFSRANRVAKRTKRSLKARSTLPVQRIIGRAGLAPFRRTVAGEAEAQLNAVAERGSASDRRPPPESGRARGLGRRRGRKTSTYQTSPVHRSSAEQASTERRRHDTQRTRRQMSPTHLRGGEGLG